MKKTGKFAVKNTAKAARFASRHTDSITVKLPFNDYYRGKGRTFTGSPIVARKPRFDGEKVTVLADGQRFTVEAYVYRFSDSNGLPLCRAQIMFRTV